MPSRKPRLNLTLDDDVKEVGCVCFADSFVVVRSSMIGSIILFALFKFFMLFAIEEFLIISGSFVFNLFCTICWLTLSLFLLLEVIDAFGADTTGSCVNEKDENQIDEFYEKK